MEDQRNTTLAGIRSTMLKAGVDALIVPYTDPHQSEYIPGHWKFREWLTGFTGSAGVVVITRDFAGLWTDSRYFLQAEEQLKGSEYQLVKLVVPHTPEYIGWLREPVGQGGKVGFDNRFFPVSMVRYYRDCLGSSGIELINTGDLITSFWNDRPTLPGKPVYDHSVSFAGVGRKQKIEAVRERLIEVKADYQFISPLDEIAWLLNLRGSDVEFCPVFISYAVVGLNEVLLFTDLSTLNPDLKNILLQDGITLREYDDMEEWIAGIPANKVVCLAPEKTTESIFNLWASKGSVMEGMNSTTALKAIKNSVEQRGLRNLMIRDGVAWVKTLCWIDSCIESGISLTEMDVARRIAVNRSLQEHYKGESFHPISSYGYHGAVVHYSVTEESSIELKPEGIFLLDTGGQFLDGTTDTTRTIALGIPTARQKMDFTLALKGTLALSMIRFPQGTRGYQLDVLARMALWQHSRNYGHGTGHGVGFFLNVHEGPQTIGTSASGYLTVTLEPGMVTTVEPAFYVPGEYGVRTENMTLVTEDTKNEFGNFYRFETLTMVPIDIRLMDLSLLSDEEIDWINDYHRLVKEKLTPFLDKHEQEWLLQATRKIDR
jgi:Xaa-Pro aminopeptidase